MEVALALPRDLERRKWPGAQSLQPPNTSRIRAGTWHACGAFSDKFGSYATVSVRGVCVVVRSPCYSSTVCLLGMSRVNTLQGSVLTQAEVLV